MAQTTLTVRMDEDIKRNSIHFAIRWTEHISRSKYVCTAVLRERRIPFEITDESDPFYSESNMKELRESIA